MVDSDFVNLEAIKIVDQLNAFNYDAIVEILDKAKAIVISNWIEEHGR